nr:MAG TPA: hypothetical protein [Caudoviricetes sp.]
MTLSGMEPLVTLGAGMVKDVDRDGDTHHAGSP